VGGVSLALLFLGYLAGWRRRRSADAAAAAGAAASDRYVQLQSQAGNAKLASMNFTWAAERCAHRGARARKQHAACGLRMRLQPVLTAAAHPLTPLPPRRSSSLLSKHAAERSALENAAAAAEKALARRVADLQNALAATQARLQEKEGILATVWAATEQLDNGAAAVLRRELDVLRAQQMKDARVNAQRTR
jgi:hypothetical protein